MEIADLELAPTQRTFGVDHRRRVDQTDLKRLCRCENLEHGPQLIYPLNRAIKQRAVRGIAFGQHTRARVGIKVRQTDHRNHLTRVYIHQNGSSPFGIHQFHAPPKHLAGGGLNGHVDRQLQRPTIQCGVTQILVIGFLNPRRADHLGRLHAFASKRCPAQNMRGQFTVRVKPHFAGTKHQSRIANVMHGLHLLGADFLTYPDKLAAARELTHQLSLVQIRENRHQFAGDAGLVDHVRRLRI